MYEKSLFGIMYNADSGPDCLSSASGGGAGSPGFDGSTGGGRRTGDYDIFRADRDIAADGITGTAADGNAGTATDGNAETDTDGNAETDADGNAETDSDGNAETDTDGNAETDSDDNAETDFTGNR